MGQLQDLRDECRELGIAHTPKHTINQLTKKIQKFKMAEETKSGTILKAQIDAWKKEHGSVYKLEVKVSENDKAVGYLRKPTRNHKATALSMYAKDKILECGEFIRNNCWLGGDERLLKENDIADSAAIQASGVVKFLDGSLGEI